jgi:hypothetical protein
MPAVFAIGGGDKTIYFDVNYGAKISAVKLKQYKSGSDDIDKIIAEITLEPSAAKPPDAGGKFMIPSDDGALSDSLMRRKDQDDLVDGLLKGKICLF